MKMTEAEHELERWRAWARKELGAKSVERWSDADMRSELSELLADGAIAGEEARQLVQARDRARMN